MPASDDEWDWKLTDPAEREYEKLQPHEQERIVLKLDEIVTDQWRDPSDYLEPLTGACSVASVWTWSSRTWSSADA